MAKKSAKPAPKKTASKKPAVKKTTVKKPAVVAKAVSAPAANEGVYKRFFNKKYEGREDIVSLFKTPKFIGALFGEIIGVFLLTLVFMITGGEPIFLLFSVMGITLAVYTLSGAHLNPLVSFGAFVTRRISALRLLFYVVAQVIGAMLAYIVLKAFLKGAPEVDEAAAMYGQTAPELMRLATIVKGKEIFLFFSEFAGASILAFFFARGLQYKKNVLNLACLVGVGFYLALFVGILVTSSYLGVKGGFAFNPALAVALEGFNNPDSSAGMSLLIYAAAPLIGGMVGFLLNDILAKSTDTIEQ